MNIDSSTKIYLLAFWLLCFPCSLLSQTYTANIEHFTTDNGLSHDVVNCVFKDSRGLVWLGTQNGLNRFDGKQFKAYNTKKYGLEVIHIQEILEDKDGMLWLVNNLKEVIIFNPYTEKAIHPKNYFQNDWEWNPENRIFYKGEQSFFILTPKNELFQYSHKNKIEKKFRLRQT